MNSVRVILFLLLMPIGLKAQVSLLGKVIDVETHHPITGIEVYDPSSGLTRTTDESGSYLFESIATGKRELIAFGLQYNTKYIEVNVEGTDTLDISLEPLNISLNAVQIVARKKELFALKRLKDVEGTSIYAGKKSEVVLLDLIQGNLGKNNAREVYARVAGLNIYEGSDGGVQLGIGGRGLDPNRTANFNTRQNSYDISADVLGYPESYYTPPSEAVEQIQIIRGASSLQYGTQFGGLINFKLRRTPVSKKWDLHIRNTNGSYGLWNAFVAGGYNSKKVSINSFFQYKQGNGYRPNSDYDVYNFHVNGLVRLTSKTSIEGEVTLYKYLGKQSGGLTDDQFKEGPKLSTRSRNWFGVDWKLYNIKLSHDWNPSSKLSISAFALDAQRNALGFRGNPIELNENPITALDEQNSDGSYVYSRDLIIGKFRNVGVESRYLHKFNFQSQQYVWLIGSKLYSARNTSKQGEGSKDVDADFTFVNSEVSQYPNQSDYVFPNFNWAMFSELIWYVNDKLSITPGIRWEYINTGARGSYKQVIFDNAGNPISDKIFEENKTLRRSFLLLGLGVDYKMTNSLKWYANVSQNYRSVTFSDIRVVSPTFIVDPNIKDEKGYTSDFGLKGRWSNVLSYDVGAYSVFYNDRIGVVLDDRANRVRKNVGKALILGFESMAEININKWLIPSNSNWLMNAFVNYSSTYARYIESEIANIEDKVVEFVPSTNLKTGLKIGYKSWMLSGQFTHLSKQYTDAQNSEIAHSGDIKNGIVGPIPSYHIVDFALSCQWQKWKLETGLNNALNRQYFTRRATGYPGPGIIPSEGRAWYVTLSLHI